MGSLPTDEEADIVTISAGTAGFVLANRLSADPAISVVVLEAGEYHSEDTRVCTPARTRELLGDVARLAIPHFGDATLPSATAAL